MKRVSLIVLIVAATGGIGSLIWNYPTWPFILVLGVVIVVNLVVPGPKGPNPQENDPTKR